MKATLLLYVCLVVGLVRCVYGADAGTTSALFVDHDLKWEIGPPGLGYETAVGAVTLFQKSGRFLRLNCTLYRDSGTAPLAVDLKSGYTVSIGRWRLIEDRKVEVKLRLIGAEKIGQPTSGPRPMPDEERTEVWTGKGGNAPLEAQSMATIRGEQRRISSLKNRNEFDRVVKKYLR